MAGIARRHSKKCPSRTGGKCDCNAGREASVYIARDRRKIRKTFPTAAAAKSWRTTAAQSAQLGGLRAPTSLTVRQAAHEWLDGAGTGVIRNRSGDAYKPSVLRGYEEALRLRVLPAIGAHKLADIAAPDVQDLIDRWHANGLSASSIRNTLMPLRVIYRRAVARGIVAVNPPPASSSPRSAAAGTGSRHPTRPGDCSTRSSTTAPCGQPPSTRDCAAASCRR